jgi:hypothetical protein
MGSKKAVSVVFVWRKFVNLFLERCAAHGKVQHHNIDDSSV